MHCEYGSQSVGCPLNFLLLSFDEWKRLQSMKPSLSIFLFYDIRNLCLFPGDKDILLCFTFLQTSQFQILHLRLWSILGYCLCTDEFRVLGFKKIIINIHLSFCLLISLRHSTKCLVHSTCLIASYEMGGSSEKPKSHLIFFSNYCFFPSPISLFGTELMFQLLDLSLQKPYPTPVLQPLVWTQPTTSLQCLLCRSQ